MSVRFKILQNKITGSKSFGKWYGKSVSLGDVDTKTLAEEISHSTTVTRSDVAAVLIELFRVMREHLQASQTVVLDEIGSFRLAIKSNPADKKENFTANNIKSFRVIYRPVSSFVANGYITAKGRRAGHYIKALTEGVTAEPFEKVKKATPTTTTNPEATKGPNGPLPSLSPSQGEG